MLQQRVAAMCCGNVLQQCVVATSCSNVLQQCVAALTLGIGKWHLNKDIVLQRVAACCSVLQRVAK